MKKTPFIIYVISWLVVVTFCALPFLVPVIYSHSQDEVTEELFPQIEIAPPSLPFVQRSVVNPEKVDLDKYLHSACRIRGGGSGGSGACFRIDDQYVYVLTCRHVVGGTKAFIAEFWIDGRITGEYTGKVSKILSVDAAVIVIPVESFKEGELPVAIPISPDGPNPNNPIMSVGCPGLSWQSLFEGHVTKMNEKPKQSFMFVPPPKGGRSGSAIFQDGKIVGVLWGATEKNGYAVNSTDLGSLSLTGNLMFSADWCKYCQQMKPVIEELRTSCSDIQVIDYDLNVAFAELYGINALPAYVNQRGEVMSGVKSVQELLEFYSAEGPK